MRPDLDAIRAQWDFIEEQEVGWMTAMWEQHRSVPVLLDYIRELEDALESLSDGRLTPMHMAPAGEWTSLEHGPCRTCGGAGFVGPPTRRFLCPTCSTSRGSMRGGC